MHRCQTLEVDYTSYTMITGWDSKTEWKRTHKISLVLKSNPFSPAILLIYLIQFKDAIFSGKQKLVNHIPYKFIHRTLPRWSHWYNMKSKETNINGNKKKDDKIDTKPITSLHFFCIKFVQLFTMSSPSHWVSMRNNNNIEVTITFGKAPFTHFKHHSPCAW